jgi:hypothetical protein
MLWKPKSSMPFVVRHYCSTLLTYMITFAVWCYIPGSSLLSCCYWYDGCQWRATLWYSMYRQCSTVSFFPVLFYIMWSVCQALIHMYVVLSGIWIPTYLQRHDIIKKRIDQLGNVIESRKDGVGSHKVYFSNFNWTSVYMKPFWFYLITYHNWTCLYFWAYLS